MYISGNSVQYLVLNCYFVFISKTKDKRKPTIFFSVDIATFKKLCFIDFDSIQRFNPLAVFHILLYANMIFLLIWDTAKKHHKN